jgi:hypothetical protein
MMVGVEIQVNLHLSRFSIQDIFRCHSCPGETPDAAVFAACRVRLDGRGGVMRVEVFLD